jgi:hypothetical protein
VLVGGAAVDVVVDVRVGGMGVDVPVGVKVGPPGVMVEVGVPVALAVEVAVLLGAGVVTDVAVPVGVESVQVVRGALASWPLEQ